MFFFFKPLWLLSSLTLLVCGTWFLSQRHTHKRSSGVYSPCHNNQSETVLLHHTSQNDNFQIRQKKGEKNSWLTVCSPAQQFNGFSPFFLSITALSLLVLPIFSLEFLLQEKQVDPGHAEMGQTKPGKHLCLSGRVLTVSTDVNQAKWLWRLQLGRLVKMETRGLTESRHWVTALVWMLTNWMLMWLAKDYMTNVTY